MSNRSIKVEDVQVGNTVLRYGMWFTVTGTENLPAERGGTIVELSLTRIGMGGRSTLTLFPGELITTQ